MSASTICGWVLVSSEARALKKDEHVRRLLDDVLLLFQRRLVGPSQYPLTEAAVHRLAAITVVVVRDELDRLHLVPDVK